MVGAGTNHCRGWTSYGEQQKSMPSLSKMTSAICAVASQCPIAGGTCKVKCSLQASPRSCALQDRLDFSWLCVQVWLPTPAQSKGRTDLKSSVWYLFDHGRVHGQVKVWAATLKVKMVLAGFSSWLQPCVSFLFPQPVLEPNLSHNCLPGWITDQALQPPVGSIYIWHHAASPGMAWPSPGPAWNPMLFPDSICNAGKL